VTITLAEALEREADAAARGGTLHDLETALAKWSRAGVEWRKLSMLVGNVRAGALRNAERCWREAAALGDRLADHCARFAEPTLTLQVLPGGRGRRAEGD
jgi:hypothetical protein